MTSSDWIALLTSFAAIITAVGGIWYQQHRISLERMEHKEKSPEKTLHGWSTGLLKPPPPVSDDEIIDVSLPYQAGAPIRNPKLFYGRKEQLASAMRCITGTNMASIFILGARKSGKTSSFYYLNHLLNPDNYPQVIPVILHSQIPISSDKNFYAYMYREASAILASRCKGNLQVPEIPREVEFDTLSTFLRQASSKGWRFVFMVDEFESLVNNKLLSGEGFFASLRSLVPQVEISWVLSSYRTVYMPGTLTSPFVNVVQDYLYLGPLLDWDARLLISEPAARAGHPFDSEDVELILDLAGRMPFLIQKACLSMYTSRRAGRGRQETRNQLNATFRLDIGPYLETQLSRLLPEEREALFDLVLQKDVTKHKITLNSLERYGLVEMKQDQYCLPGRSWEDYLYRKAKESMAAAD